MDTLIVMAIRLQIVTDFLLLIMLVACGGSQSPTPLITNDPVPVTPKVGVIARINLNSDGTETRDLADGDHPTLEAAISDDGRFVAFSSTATGLVSGDTNNASDIFLRDTCVSAGSSCQPNTTRVSAATGGSQTDGASFSPVISSSGRFVGFTSIAPSLVGAGNDRGVFLRDTCNPTASGCTPVLLTLDATPPSFSPYSLMTNGFAITPDACWFAYAWDFFDFVLDAGFHGLEVHATGITDRSACSASVGAGSQEGEQPKLSANGRFLAYMWHGIAYWWDTCAGAPTGCIQRKAAVSLPDSNTTDGTASEAVLSADGRFVAFSSNASNIVAGDTNAKSDVFVRDTCQGAASDCAPRTVRVSVASDGTEANGASSNSQINNDGSVVAFTSESTNLANATAGRRNVFIRTTCLTVTSGCIPATKLISAAPDGTPGNGNSFAKAMTRDSRYVVIRSEADNLVNDDKNGSPDLFLIRTRAE